MKVDVISGETGSGRATIPQLFNSFVNAQILNFKFPAQYPLQK